MARKNNRIPQPELPVITFDALIAGGAPDYFPEVDDNSGLPQKFFLATA